MFSSHGSFRFLRKFQSLLVLCTKPPTSCNVHSLRLQSPKQIASRTPKTSYMREIITRISNILRYSTWEVAQEELQNLSVKCDSYTVTQVLKTHPPMEKAWLFFNWADKLKGFKHDQFSYTTMLDIFGEAGRISSMMYVFRKMQEKGVKIDVVTYTSLLHWLSKDGDVDGAVELWEVMKEKGCRPTVVSYTAYMKILFEHDRVKEASEVYKEMLEAGCSPNCHTYTVLMEHLANLGKFDEVLEIFSKMQDAGVQPDKASCNVLVEKCCKEGNTRTMTKILQYMKENSLVLRYPVYIQALKSLQVAGESDILLRRVNPHLSTENFNGEGTDRSNQTTAADVTCNSDREIILGLLNKKKLVAVDTLLIEMMGKRIALDSGTTSTIIEVNVAECREAGATLAFEYSDKMGINVHGSSYLASIGMFIGRNSFPNAVSVVEKMVREGLSLGTQLSALLVYRLGCAREPVAAATVFSLLPDEEKNTTTTYTALIGAFFASGKADKGLEAFQTMRKLGITPSLGTYRVLLSGLERNGWRPEMQTYRKEKKAMVASYDHSRSISTEEKLCDLLFAGKYDCLA